MSHTAHVLRLRGHLQSAPEPAAGGVYLLKWVEETWGQAARESIGEILFSYLVMLIGFLFLYLMIRNTARISEFRQKVGSVLNEQRKRKFDLDDYRAMPGAGGYF